MIRILYIAGAGRSGSTICDTLLGQLPGTFNIGEAMAVFRGRRGTGHYCGCGTCVASCPVWTRVLERALGNRPQSPNFLGLRGRVRVLLRLRRDRECLDRFYRAIHEVTGCRWIIDSSKEVSYARLLETIPGVRLRVVHLIRDPRAVLHSWQRRRPDTGVPGRPMMLRRGAFSSLCRWTAVHAASELRWPAGRRRMRVRYEDLVQQPEGVLRKIARFAGLSEDRLPVAGRLARLEPTHTLWGNPSRMRTGEVALHPDEEWRGAIGRGDRWLAAALAGPLMARYGYRAGPGR